MPLVLTLLLLTQENDGLLKSTEQKLLAGDLKGALAELDKALALEPTSTPLLKARAGVKGRLKDWDGMIADLNVLLEKGGREKADHLLLRSLARQEKADLVGALADLNEALKLDPDDSGFVLQRRARILLSLGEWDRAILDFDKALELEPLDPAALRGRAIARTRKGDEPGALADMNKAIERDPNSYEGYFGRADIHLTGLRYEKALEDLLVAAKNSMVANVSFANLRWLVRARAGKRVEADQDLRKVGVVSDRPIVLALYGYLLGDLSEEDLMKTSGRDPSWKASVEFHMGIKKLSEGHQKEGLADLKRALEGVNRASFEFGWARAELAAAGK